MRKFAMAAAELEAIIRVEMENICEWPTDMTVSVQPDGDSWKVVIVQDGSDFDSSRHEMILLIANRLRCEFDWKP
jgi:hypothetical protein